MCTDADHAPNDERELLALLREQLSVSKQQLQASRQTNELLMVLVDVLSEEQVGESNNDQDPNTYLDGTPIR